MYFRGLKCVRHRKVLGLDVPISILLLSWDISATLDGYLYNSIISYLYPIPIYYCSDNCETTVAPNVPFFAYVCKPKTF